LFSLYYPAPPHLHYLYPPPNPHILRNILTAIVAVPKLYTQVLHLMNKMNLPPPFEDKEWAPPSHPMVEAVMARDKTTTQAPPAPPAPAPAAEKRKRDELLSSDESEIVSEEESTRPVTIQQIRRRR
jgi:U11/U12 small nuclear ribonucleoprotein SNRNP65